MTDVSAVNVSSVLNVSMVNNLAGLFAIEGELQDIRTLGGGHINDSFVSTWIQGGEPRRYTHQRINSFVFKRPDLVMENILRVTSHIRGKLPADRERRTLTVIPARDGKPWVRDQGGGWWRTYRFIEGAHTRETAGTPEEAAVLGKSIGRFQKQLADLPCPPLHESIQDFHNMEARYRRFYRALSDDAYGRAREAGPETAFFKENEERGGILVRAMRAGLPSRVCHNDAKMNNILLDDASGEALCIIDLDTVMTGTCLFDLGDLIRSATSRAAEDERNLSLVRFDLDFFKSLLTGYLSEAGDFLTAEEGRLLCEAGRNITQIMALRFLTDYLEGDRYYRTDKPGHNLDRCRNQIALIQAMDACWEQAEHIARQAAQTFNPLHG
jgi:Ser/Thr protein kinase RdoA (MazF antagonist)